LAGRKLRDYVIRFGNLSGVIDLEHFQPFEATTYTIISRFNNSDVKQNEIEYYDYDANTLEVCFQECLPYDRIVINKDIYISRSENLNLLSKIKLTYSYPYVMVKNGFATLADKVFIGDFDFPKGLIDVLKASTGKWSKCIYPYDELGNPLPIKELVKSKGVYEYLLSYKETLIKNKKDRNDNYWYLFGRSQALKDVSKVKYAINTIVKDLRSIRLEVVPQGCGIYSGLYILSEIEFDTIKELVCSSDFIEYVKLLKKYKSGGYYTFASKDLEQYLNYKLTERYGQSRLPQCCREFF
jgi:adenine-specific DNA-methyltransferase